MSASGFLTQQEVRFWNSLTLTRVQALTSRVLELLSIKAPHLPNVAQSESTYKSAMSSLASHKTRRNVLAKPLWLSTRVVSFSMAWAVKFLIFASN